MQYQSLALQDMTCAVLIALFGVLCCYYDAEGVKHDNLEVNVDTDIHSHAVQPNFSGILRKKRQFTLGGNVGWRGRPTWGGSLGYNFGRGYSTGLDYSGSIGYNRFGANIGYQRGGWNVKGYGHVNTRGGWGAGASIGYRFKRSLSEV